jgi:chromate reductase
LRPVEQLQAIFAYRNAHLFPVRVFLPQINSLLDSSGKIKDAELAARLRAQAEGFAKFAEKINV